MKMLMRILASAFILGLLLAACGDDDSEHPTATAGTGGVATATAQLDDTVTEASNSTATQPVTGNTSPAPTSDDQITAVERAADQVMQAIRDRDRDHLHDMTGHHLRDRMHDQDFDQMMQCIPDGATVDVLARVVEIDNGTATVTHTMQLTTADGQVTEIERTWIFEQADDGTWLLSERPDCPFQQ